MSLLKSLWRELKGSRPALDATTDLATQLHALAPRLRQPQQPGWPAALTTLQGLCASHPRSVDAHSLLGDALLAAQRRDEAEHAYREALKLQPEHAGAQEGLGLCLLQGRRLDEAYLHLEMAHKLAPMNADILVHWGLVELELGHLAGACQRFTQAIERAPDNGHAWLNLGLALYRLGQFEASVAHLQRAVALKPQHALGHSNLALALRQTGDLPGAHAAAQRATELKPDNARLWVIHADLALNAGDFDAATAALDRALTLDAGHIGVHIGLGKLHMARARPQAAQAAFESALAIDPRHAEARHGLAQLHLLHQRWTTGWDLYEARRELLPNPVRLLPQPEWHGEALGRQSLLVHAEQGLGDTILFASCLPDLLAQPIDCVLDVPPRLATLFQRSFPSATVVSQGAGSHDDDWFASLPPTDRHVPLGSLPRLLRRDAEHFGHGAAFLHADAAKVTAWQQRLSHLQRPRIGLSWRGGMVSTSRLQRSLPLATLLTALSAVPASWVSLQYGDTVDEIAAAQAQTGIEIHAGLGGYADLDDLAALTCALDAVITVCSTQAHLSGALGQAAAVLVPVNPNWLYGANGRSMPWYGSLTLLRQHETGEWRQVLEQAAAWVGEQGRPAMAG